MSCGIIKMKFVIICRRQSGTGKQRDDPIADGDHKTVSLTPDDVVVSSDPIPGNQTQ